MWYSKDPRHFSESKQPNRIVVFRMGQSITLASVNKDNVYRINGPDLSLSINDSWNDTWLWTYAPYGN